MRAFWRDKELSVDEVALVAACLAAHRACVARDNLSSIALKLAAGGSGDYSKALIAALSTLGGIHAPIERTVNFLTNHDPASLVKMTLQIGKKIPGWGNSFVKGQKDPLWLDFEAALNRAQPALCAKLGAVTAALHICGKPIFPNPSAYTAATAIAVGLPGRLAPWLLVRGRLDAWTELLAKEEAVWAH